MQGGRHMVPPFFIIRLSMQAGLADTLMAAPKLARAPKTIDAPRVG